MTKIAVLLTCHNRKEKTINALTTVYRAAQVSKNEISLHVFLTDDGSTDGTKEAVMKEFPAVVILEGDGNLFWAKGMRVSWEAAIEEDFDMYLLLNDDVEIYDIAFDQLFDAHHHCMNTYNKVGIYIGATEDKHQKLLTYSGSIVLSKFLYTQKRLPPNGDYQLCDLANANIMLVPKEVVDQIGIISGNYSHGVADYDYTLRATTKNIPVVVAPKYCGHCEYDHKDPYTGFVEMSLQERKAYLNSPRGLAQKSYNRYMRKFFPWRYPLVAFFGWFKLYFPKYYLKYFRER